MYSSFTCINNSKLEKAKILFSDLIKDVDKKTLQIDTSAIQSYSYYNQEYWDLISFLNAIGNSSKQFRQKNEALKSFIKNELIVFHYINPKIEFDSYSGISILSLQEKYNPDYEKLFLYKEIKKLKMKTDN